MSAPSFTFSKATKRAARARVALDGPSGAGKTWTALEWASVLGERIALIDTERGSASLYSDRFDFDVLEMAPPFEPQRLVAALRAAEQQGYDVVVVDSLSHWWEGEGGVLDVVDAAAERAKGNSFAGWKVGTPAYRHLIDTILALDCHVIATMRSKTEWVLETDQRGKQVPRRVGMAPVMRAGAEYEFTLIGDLDLEHRLVVTKSRAEPLADLVVQPGRAAEAAQLFKRWLESGEPIAARAEVEDLKTRMNALPSDVRMDAKRGFVECFGQPEYLLASRVAEAVAYVATFENPPPPDGGGNGDTQKGAGDDGSDSGGDAAQSSDGADGHDVGRTEPEPAPASAAEEAPKARKRSSGASSRPQQNKHWKVAALLTEVGLTDDERHAFVHEWTKGRTRSTKDLTSTEAAHITWGIEKLKDGGTVAAGDLDALLARVRELAAQLRSAS